MSAPQRISYLARRRAGLSAEDWLPVWRAHWALAASQPESATVRRYAQCEVLVDDAPLPHHAIAHAEYVSPEARVANRTATAYHAIMRADEERVFQRVIAECSFIGEHHVLAGADSGPFKVVRFVRHRGGAGPSDRLGDWAQWASSSSPALLGYSQDHTIAPERPEGWGLAVDGSEEFWFGNRFTAERFLRSEHLRIATTKAPFTVVSAVVTDEVVLKDDRAHPA